ncbi:hypothetical protein [Hymenobacter sublimis]|uniref:Uncharacterized protein n=1 Tax=Hymenobacter sublimis TaxID=2933777 RepID=A0ABY4JF19_9BACT|nr:hypothetical protein [Hymenobacter sublimis]UPL51395.1 hypothetical protein MWH26_19870 [Hymenobacter sublimis]
MNQHFEGEPEDAGLIQSKPPTKQELQEISRFIAQSKQRNTGQLNGLSPSVEHQQSQEKES